MIQTFFYYVYVGIFSVNYGPSCVVYQCNVLKSCLSKHALLKCKFSFSSQMRSTILINLLVSYNTGI